MSDNLFPAERLGELLRYCPQTGLFTWKARPTEMFPNASSAARWNGRYAGKPALTAKNEAGYPTGRLMGKHVKAHAVAWAISHGRWPREIDHINGDKADNRLSNLREATRQENSCNRSLRSDNRTGAVGISHRKGKWLARIQVAGKPVCLGTFATADEAIAARQRASEEAGYHPNHGRTR